MMAEAKQAVISNNNPITDIVKETNAMTAVATNGTTTTATKTPNIVAAGMNDVAIKQLPSAAITTQLTTNTSKIPHLQQPQQQQQQQHSPQHSHGRDLKQLLHSTDPIRRSASLRMRGSKSNLLNNCSEHFVEMERGTRHLSNMPNSTASRYNHPLTGVLETHQLQQQKQLYDHHATHTAGTLGGATATATRRKATLLFGSALSTQTPAVTVGNLTRSQSLRRSYLNYNYNSQQKSSKTDAIKDQGTGGGSFVDSGAGTETAIKGTAVVDNVALLTTDTQHELQTNGGENCAVPNGFMQGNDIMYKSDGVGEQRRIDRDMQRMVSK